MNKFLEKMLHKILPATHPFNQKEAEEYKRWRTKVTINCYSELSQELKDVIEQNQFTRCLIYEPHKERRPGR